jgi:hypothetical protein
MEARGVDARQMFMTATLMCLVWLAALTMLVRQAQFTDFAANRARVMSGQSLAFLPTFQR